MSTRLEAFCTSGTSPTLSAFGPVDGPHGLVLGRATFLLERQPVADGPCGALSRKEVAA